jgi:glycosyltransferase involved in cell wall biosynthesis
MCRALRESGVVTLIATTDADGAGRLEVETGQCVTYENVPAIFFSRQLSEAYKYSRPLAQWLGAHVREFDMVHIHAVFSHASLAAAQACRKEGIPYVVRPLGTLDPWSLRQKSWRKKLFWHLGVKRLLAGAARIHYTTSTERKLAEASLGLAGGVVIPLGIEADLFNQHREANNGSPASSSVTSPYVLVLSRLHRKKGLEVLLPAFLSLVKYPEFAAWKLVLAGDGEAK